jgi:hypothetical protein
MTSISARAGRTWRGLAVVTALVAGVLVTTAAPANADHFIVSSRSYLDPWPLDAGGRAAAISISRTDNLSTRVYGTFGGYLVIGVSGVVGQ